MATIVHAMPGRARLRIAARRGDGVFFAAVASGLSAIPGVYRVEVRPLTGSILIEHGPPLEHIGAAAQKARLFALERTVSEPPAPPISIDPKVVIGLGLGALSLWQIAEGRIFPPAITLAWYAAHLTGLMAHGDAAEDGA
jgi:hypothetical protein